MAGFGNRAAGLPVPGTAIGMEPPEDAKAASPCDIGTGPPAPWTSVGTEPTEHF